jgi:ribosomal protein S18 acetylase RimI-like enzyme/predicted double-glycine peptidase
VTQHGAAPLPIRPAVEADLPELLRLEETCFTEDRLSRRSFRRFLGSHTAALLVAPGDAQGDVQRLAGYALVLFHRGTSLARLYSIAVDPACRGTGVGQNIMGAAEQAAAARKRAFLRLEVRADNIGAIRLYEQRGYRHFGDYDAYYADRQDALRFQKRVLKGPPQPERQQLTYYAQTTPFTCGPAALMMTLHALDQRHPINRREEMALWRESTTIYMTTGHGGCSPLGLALAAIRRGEQASVLASQPGPWFLDSVRSAEKKAVIALVHEDYEEQLGRYRDALQLREPTLADIEQVLRKGGYGIALINTWHFDYQRTPHWVVLSGIDADFVYIHDPFVDSDDLRYDVDNQYLPIQRERFLSMWRYGASKLRVLIRLQRKRRARSSGANQTLPSSADTSARSGEG